ncbi:MAG: hypothetical protein GY883_11135 [Shimia sp.]|nr:hypothetical protein [Shimia sp.]
MRDSEDAQAAPEERCWEMIAEGSYVDRSATLESVMPMFEASGAAFVPVVTLGGEDKPPELVGAVFHVDALRAFNKALAETAAEEHS